MALSASAEIGNPFAHNPNLILVPVIASFDTLGKIIPLYFRYEGLRLKIDHIKWFNDRTVDVIKFCCEITLQDRVQEVILYYHKKNGMSIPILTNETRAAWNEDERIYFEKIEQKISETIIKIGGYSI